MDNTVRNLMIAGLVLLVVIIAAYMIHSGNKEMAPELGGVDPWSKELKAKRELLGKLEGLTPLYKETPTLGILPIGRQLNELDLTERQVNAVGATEKAFLPRWQQRMGAANETIQTAYIRFDQSRKAGDQAGMDLARRDIATAVAAHQKTLEELNAEYHAMMLKFLLPYQAKKFTLQPVNPSPVPELK